MKKLLFLLIAVFAFANLFSQSNITLPAPQKTGGMPLMEALSKRATSKAFDTTKELTMQQLSNLLWASFGINRSDGRRTAPSASNKQEIDIYVLLKQGAYVYDAQKHELNQVTSEDIRSQAADQRFADAPVQLIFIADLAKRGESTEVDKIKTANIDCGYISQNTYLYCTSEGLVTGARGSMKRDVLLAKLNLRPDQRILIAHSVGYPKP
jgi:SagB-type dehydrogenase family enzyme